MDGIFDFFQRNATGIFVFLIALTILAMLFVLVFQKICWILERGRFKLTEAQKKATSVAESSVGMVISAFFAKLIDEFRHLLALLIFLLFAGTLIYGIAVAGSGIPSGTDVKEFTTLRLDNIEKVIQVIVASLGGLVGSIMGYYFGEARAKPSSTTPVQSATVQQVAPPPAVVAPSSATVPTPPPGSV